MQIAEFKQPQAEEIKTTYMSKTTTKSKTDRVKITCAAFDEKSQVLTCGLSDGTIMQYINQKLNNKVRKLTMQETDLNKGLRNQEIQCTSKYS